jgi:hypothetical protein
MGIGRSQGLWLAARGRRRVPSGSDIASQHFFEATPLGSVFWGLPTMADVYFIFFSKISLNYFNISVLFQRFLNFNAFVSTPNIVANNILDF